MSLADWQIQLSQCLVLPSLNLPEQPFENRQLPALHGVARQKLDLYRELMFNTVLESLENIYPFTHQLISEGGQNSEYWMELAERYRRDYPNLSHKLMGAVENFPRFIAEQSELMDRFPFVAELAQYEWLEMQVSNLPEQVLITEDFIEKKLPDLGNFAFYTPTWNEAHALQSFYYPIPDLLSTLRELEEYSSLQQVEAQATEILIYRDPIQLHVRFFCLNGITSLLLRLSLANAKLSYQDLISQLQVEVPALQTMPLETITEQASHLFQHCLDVGVLLGSKFVSSHV